MAYFSSLVISLFAREADPVFAVALKLYPLALEETVLLLNSGYSLIGRALLRTRWGAGLGGCLFLRSSPLWTDGGP